MKSLMIAVLAAAGLTFVAGCAGVDTDSDSDSDSAAADIDSADQASNAPLSVAVAAVTAPEATCAGVWEISEKACACPAIGASDYTPECQAADCMHSEIMALSENGEALHVTVRYTASEQHLSAIGYVAVEGSWKDVGGSLMIALGSNATTVPTHCTADELRMRGQDPIKRANASLASSIAWAWGRDQWIDVPYKQ
jgi:hypothetical protein